MKRFLILSILTLFVGIQAWSQESTQTDIDLNAQYKILKDKAETYGEYKVFKVSKLDEFWSSVGDSMAIVRGKLNEKQTTIENQSAEIETLNTTAAENEEKFQQNEFAATHIEFLGIDFGKSTFIIIMSVLVIGLALILAIGYIQFNHLKRVSTQNVTACKKLEHDYEELRKKSLEKQIQLKRELQTERNLIEEFRNKSTVTKKISA